MKRIQCKCFLCIFLVPAFLFADDIDKYEQKLLLLEDEAGRIKSDIIRLEKEIAELNLQIELNKQRTDDINKEIENIVRVLYYINIEKKINPFVMKDIETKNIRYGEYIRSMIKKYDENLEILKGLNKDYQQKIEMLNQRLEKSSLVKKELDIKINKIYQLIYEKNKNIKRDVVKYKKMVLIQREESNRKIDEVTKGKREKNENLEKSDEQFSIIWPVRQGDVIREFGTYYDENIQLEKFSKGIIIKSPFLSEIYCVSDGKVLFSGWLKGFGNTVIVEHTYGFISVYSHLARADVARGEDIKKGDVLGFVGDTGSSEGIVLYFELRRNGKAVDPMNYIK